MRSGLDVLGGRADGHAVLHHRVACLDGAQGELVTEGDGRGQGQAVLCDLVFHVEIQQRGDVVVGMDGEADAGHGVLYSCDALGRGLQVSRGCAQDWTEARSGLSPRPGPSGKRTQPSRGVKAPARTSLRKG
jgi:hypothetical protein